MCVPLGRAAAAQVRGGDMCVGIVIINGEK